MATVPAGKKLHVEYVILGLKAQTAELLAGMSDLKAAQFTAKKAKYQKVIQWIEANV